MSPEEINLPKYIRILTYVEIFERGNIIKLSAGMYKLMDGCIFGISIDRAMRAIQNKDAEIYYPQQVNEAISKTNSIK